MVLGPSCGIDSADKCQMPELPRAAWHLHKWFSAPFMLPVNYVYAFSEVIRENRHNRQPRQPDWDGIYHMATAAGGGERCSRLPHNFDLAKFTHLDFSHTRRAAIPYRVDYLPTILSHLLICCLELKKKHVRRCNELKGPGCKTQSYLVAAKKYCNIASSISQNPWETHLCPPRYTVA